MEKIPENSYELIKILKQEYKEKCPEFSDTDRDIFYYKGKVDLVKFLVDLMEYQKNKEK